MNLDDFRKELSDFLNQGFQEEYERKVVIQTGTKGHAMIKEAMDAEFKQRVKIAYINQLKHHGVSDKEIDVVLNYVDQNELDLASAVSSAAIARSYRKYNH